MSESDSPGQPPAVQPPAQPPAVPGEGFNPHPIRLVVADDLHRHRLTVLFRLIMAYPALIYLALWTIPILFVLIAQWFYTLFKQRPHPRMHAFIGRYVRQYTVVTAYVLLLAEPYPNMRGLPGDYPIDLQIDPPAHQAWWKTLLRSILAIPAYVLAYIFGYLAQIVAVIMWIVGIIMGRVPKGLRDFASYMLRWQTQTWAYLYLLTDRYPALSTPEPKGPVDVVPPKETLTGNYV
jgi:uncharacterized protein DUF4389